MTRIVRVHNPVAAANRRRPQVVPPKKGKGSYNRKRDKHASEDRQVPHQAGKQTPDD